MPDALDGCLSQSTKRRSSLGSISKSDNCFRLHGHWSLPYILTPISSIIILAFSIVVTAGAGAALCAAGRAAFIRSPMSPRMPVSTAYLMAKQSSAATAAQYSVRRPLPVFGQFCTGLTVVTLGDIIITTG